ncbi:MAG: type II toxin-antitoxin system PemK/MazF family toxin [Chloroflexi bacterium]|nr:type II toxin-antitoxin system PemK/MazF family toxin [Chloroflexota bacterium]
MTQTQSTTSISRGDVVLVPFPFTDLSGSKYRPAVVVSDDSYNRTTRDIVIGQITGNMNGPPREGDCRITDWQQAGLKAPSIFRAKLATIAESRMRRIGRMPASDMQSIESSLKRLLRL